MTRRIPDWLPLVLALLAIAASYNYLYFNYPAVPDHDPAHALGWFSWNDQSLYLRSARAFLVGDLTAAQHVYPPLYPLLGAALLPWLPLHSLYPVDLVLALAYGGVAFALLRPYAGPWLAAIAIVFGMLQTHDLALQWVIPWTTTPAAVLLVGALVLLERRMRLGATWGPAHRAAHALLFGLCVGLIVPTRPGDAAAAVPIAIAYGWIAIHQAAQRRKERGGWPGAINVPIELATGVVGAAIPIAALLVFNAAVYGSPTGSYARMADANGGFDILGLGTRLFSHLLASGIYYGEPGDDWMSRIPWTLAALTLIPPVLFLGPPILRVLAAAMLVHIVVTLSFVDALPTGAFRYFNIHWFKWMIPLMFGVAAWVLRALTSAESRAVLRSGIAAIIAVVICAFAVTTTADYRVLPATVSGEDAKNVSIRFADATAVDFIDIAGLGGSWAGIYHSRDNAVTLDGTRQLSNARDFRLLPIPGGARLLFLRPVTAQALSLVLGAAATIAPPFDGAAVPVAVRVHLGLPFAQPAAPPLPRPPYALGRVLDFANPETLRYLGPGWSTPETWGRWTEGETSTLQLRIVPAPAGDLTLRVVAAGLVAKGRDSVHTTAFANGVEIGSFDSGAEAAEVTLRIPTAALDPDGPLRLDFSTKDTASPESLDMSADARQLGIAVSSVVVSAAGN